MSEHDPDHEAEARLWAYAPHLASERSDLTDYRVRTTDGQEAGTITSQVTDGELSYLVIAGNGHGSTHLVPAGVVGDIDDDDRLVSILMSSDDLRSAPGWAPADELSEEYRRNLFDHFSSWSW